MFGKQQQQKWGQLGPLFFVELKYLLTKPKQDIIFRKSKNFYPLKKNVVTVSKSPEKPNGDLPGTDSDQATLRPGDAPGTSSDLHGTWLSTKTHRVLSSLCQEVRGGRWELEARAGLVPELQAGNGSSPRDSAPELSPHWKCNTCEGFSWFP